MNLPQACVFGKSFSVEHAFSCPCGGFPFIRHNEIHDLTTSLLSEVCSNVRCKSTAGHIPACLCSCVATE